MNRSHFTLLASILVVSVLSASSVQAQEQAEAAKPTSAESSDRVTMTWHNNFRGEASFVWVEPNGNELGNPANRIAAGRDFTGVTMVGHVFVFNVGGRRLTYMVPDGKSVPTIPTAGQPQPVSPVTRKEPEQRIVVFEELGRQARDLFRYTYSNNSETGTFVCLNGNEGGYGSVWKKTATANSNGKARATLFFAEIARTPEYVMLRNPATKHTVRLYRNRADEIFPTLRDWQTLAPARQGSWYIPR